jgi:hypothetical protein
VPFHEVYAYALDAAPMMLALCILAVLHPGRFLVDSECKLTQSSIQECETEELQGKASQSVQDERTWESYDLEAYRFPDN